VKVGGTYLKYEPIFVFFKREKTWFIWIYFVRSRVIRKEN
jgi:hypothetical protein